MFHPQTTEIQLFKTECFSTKMLKFQQYDVIIYDVSVDFRGSFGMLNSLVMSYHCAKFQHDITVNDRITCIFHAFCFVYCVFFDKRQKSQYNNIINFMQIFYNFLANTLIFYGIPLCKI